MQLDSLNKKEYWENHIKKWEASNVSQKSYCASENIKLTTFVYWRSHLSKIKTKKFVPVEISQPPIDVSIKIKLVTGNIVCIPVSIGILEIAKLIRFLETNNA